MLATLIEWDALLKVIWMSLVATIGITMVFSFAIVGAAGFSESRRDGRRGAAVAFAVLAAVALTVCIAAVVFGLVVMTSKD